MATAADHIVSHLLQATERINTANSSMAAADERARTVHAKMTRAGFLGIAEGISDIIGKIEVIQASLAQATGRIGQAHATLGAITDQTTLDQVVTLLTTARDKQSQARSDVASTVDQTRQGGDKVAAVLHGGMPEYLQSMFHQAHQATSQASTVLDTATDLSNKAIEEARRSGGHSEATASASPHAALSSRESEEAQAGSVPTRRPKDQFDITAQDRWAAEAYQRFRQDDRDIDSISHHLAGTADSDLTHVSRDDIAQVKDHLMRNSHAIEDPETGTIVNRRFDPDSEIAAAWTRLRSGRSRPEDLVLIKHELAETSYMRSHPGATYRDAHTYANSQHNWQDLDKPFVREDLSSDW